MAAPAPPLLGSHGPKRALASLPIPAAWRRRAGILAAVAATLVALYAAVGFFLVPRIVVSKIETLALAELGRHATVGKAQFNPFTLQARLADFALADRDPARTLLRFDTLDVDVSSASLWKRAPVLDAVRLVRPQVELARAADGRYNVQDLIDRALAPSAGPKAEAVFAINNIEIEEGSIVFDDAVEAHRTAVTRLAIGIPFLSSFTRDAQIRVRPHLEGAIDDAPFALAGTASSPFEDPQQASLQFDLDALPLPRYVEYAPLPNGLQLKDGALTTRLALTFVMSKGSARGITLSGNARLDRLAIARKDSSPLVAAKAVEVALGKLDLVNHSVAVDRLAVVEPEADLRRLADGALELQRLLALPASARPAKTDGAATAGAPGAPWSWSVGEAHVSGGTLRIADQAVTPAYQNRLTGVTLDGTKLASRGAAGKLDVAFDSEDGAHFAAQSEVDVEGSAARGHFALTQLALAKLFPYYAGVLAIDVRRGALDFGGDFDAGAGPGAPRFTLAQGSAELADLDVAVRGEREALWRMPRASATGIALDLGKRSVAVDRIEAQQGAIRALRDADGGMHFEHALRTAGGGVPAQAAGGAPASADWRVVVRELLLERFGVDFEDRGTEPAVRVRIADARIAAENVDSAPGARAKVQVAARIGAKGRVRVDGVAAARPAMADLRLNATGLDLVALRPYLESRTNVVLTSGAAAAKGRVTYTDAGAAGPRARFVGNLVVSDLASLDRPGSQELLRWKTLTVTGADLTSAPFKLAVDTLALDQFYARLILGADAKLNVLQLLAKDSAAQGPAAQGPAVPGSVPPDSAPQAVQAASAPAGERREIPASIGRIELSNGEVEYSDFFVKPNYSVHLTDLKGDVSALAAAQAGTVEITAKVDGAAPVDIRGALNPFAKELALDLTGKATGVDLPPLTPYSVKYAGYGIQKGKLSMEVHYKLDDRKLAAQNKLVLDQLTFGERVESPTATKLPVLLAVALLKDRNGVINLDLPISGTLDDPKFSMGRVIVQIIVNLLTKAATAPFALLGALVGGGGEQLAYLEFAPGRAVITPAAEAKLTTLAKALADRPGLKLEAAGRAIPEVDSAGLRRAMLDRALRVRKQKDLASAGESAPALDAITIDAADHARYLKAVYRDADLPNKPRNFIGIAKDIPAAEMESLLLAGYKVDDNALRELANDRAQVVKDWFVAKGGIEAARLFVVAPRLTAEGVKGEGAPTRVDFAIK